MEPINKILDSSNSNNQIFNLEQQFEDIKNKHECSIALINAAINNYLSSSKSNSESSSKSNSESSSKSSSKSNNDSIFVTNMEYIMTNYDKIKEIKEYRKDIIDNAANETVISNIVTYFKKEWHDKTKRKGIHNSGVTCYFNSATQLLRDIPELYFYNEYDEEKVKTRVKKKQADQREKNMESLYLNKYKKDLIDKYKENNTEFIEFVLKEFEHEYNEYKKKLEICKKDKNKFNIDIKVYILDKFSDAKYTVTTKNKTSMKPIYINKDNILAGELLNDIIMDNKTKLDNIRYTSSQTEENFIKYMVGKENYRLINKNPTDINNKIDKTDYFVNKYINSPIFDLNKIKKDLNQIEIQEIEQSDEFKKYENTKKEDDQLDKIKSIHEFIKNMYLFQDKENKEDKNCISNTIKRCELTDQQQDTTEFIYKSMQLYEYIKKLDIIKINLEYEYIKKLDIIKIDLEQDIENIKYTKLNKYVIIMLTIYQMDAQGNCTKYNKSVNIQKNIVINETEYETLHVILHTGESVNSGHYISYGYLQDGSDSIQVYNDTTTKTLKSVNEINSTFNQIFNPYVILLKKKE
jgi:hypothetical protein